MKMNRSIGVDGCRTGWLCVSIGPGEEVIPERPEANAAGALSTLKRGAQESLPRRQEIESFLKNGSCN
jgi:hypothetical protein